MAARSHARWLSLALAVTAGCSSGPLASQAPLATRSAVPSTGVAVASPPATEPPSAAAVPSLENGPITPGTYLFEHRVACNDPPRDCPVGATPPPALGVQLTVPSGWVAATDAYLISAADGREPGAPSNSALVMGWTGFYVGLNSEPCSQISHQPTDIDVGPSVDDFVEAVVAHPKLEITEPMDVSLGGYQGRFFALTGPANISGCEEWRPWDPGFYAQGPNNLWDVWVMDVNGFRILIVTESFPETPADVKAELRSIVESIRFVP